MIRGRLAGAALALVGAAACGPAAAQDRAAPRIATMAVEGLASRDVAPDTALITLGVTTDKPSALDASTQTTKVATALVAEVKASGVSANDIATTQATVTPLYDTGATPKLRGFRAANVIQIAVHQLDTAGDLAGRLLDKGANELQGIDFVVTKPEPILDEIRAEATRDARRRAEIYAKAAGVTLARIVEIQPEAGAPQPFAPRMKMSAMMDAGRAPVPLEAGRQTLEARVTITWELAPGTP